MQDAQQQGWFRVEKMESLPLFLISLSVKEIACLPETKAALDKILRDPALKSLTMDQALLVGSLFFRHEIVEKEFLLDWTLQICESLGDLRPLARGFLAHFGTSMYIDFDYEHGSYMLASHSLLRELRSVGFDSVVASGATESAMAVALDVSRSTTRPFINSYRERDFEARLPIRTNTDFVLLPLADRLERILTVLLRTPAPIPEQELCSLLSRINSGRFLSLDENLLFRCIEKVLETSSRPALCPVLWGYSGSRDAEEKLVFKTIRSSTAFKSRVVLAYLVSEAIARGIGIWAEMGPQLVDFLLDATIFEGGFTCATEILQTVAKLLASSFTARQIKLPSEVFQKLITLCDKGTESPDVRLAFNVICTDTLNENVSQLVDLSAFARSFFLAQPVPFNEVRLHRLTKLLLALPTSDQESVIAEVLNDNLQVLASAQQPFVDIVVAWPAVKVRWFFKVLPTLFYRLPRSNREGVFSAQMRMMLEKTDWELCKPEMLMTTLPSLLLLFYYPLVSPDEAPEKLTREDTVIESLTTELQGDLALNRSVAAGILRSVFLVATGGVETSLIDPQDVAVFRLYSALVHPMHDLPVSNAENAPLEALVQHCLRYHGDTFLRFSNSTSFWEDSAQVFQMLMNYREPDKLRIRFACAISTCTRISFELENRSLLPSEWRSLYEATGRLLRVFYDDFLWAQARRYAARWNRTPEECMGIVSLVTLRSTKNAMSQCFQCISNQENAEPADDDDDFQDEDDNLDGDSHDDNDDDDDDNSEDDDDELGDYAEVNRKLTDDWMSIAIDHSASDVMTFTPVLLSLNRCLRKLRQCGIGEDIEQLPIREQVDELVQMMVNERRFYSIFRSYNFVGEEDTADIRHNRFFVEERDKFLNLIACTLDRARLACRMPALLACLVMLSFDSRAIGPIPIKPYMNLLFALISSVWADWEGPLHEVKDVLNQVLKERPESTDIVRQYFAENVAEFDFANYFRYCAQAVHEEVDASDDFVRLLLTVLPFEDVLGTLMSFSHVLVKEYPSSIVSILRSFLLSCVSDENRRALFALTVDILAMMLDPEEGGGVANERGVIASIILFLDRMAFPDDANVSEEQRDRKMSGGDDEDDGIEERADGDIHHRTRSAGEGREEEYQRLVTWLRDARTSISASSNNNSKRDPENPFVGSNPKPPIRGPVSDLLNERRRHRTRMAMAGSGTSEERKADLPEALRAEHDLLSARLGYHRRQPEGSPTFDPPMWVRQSLAAGVVEEKADDEDDDDDDDDDDEGDEQKGEGGESEKEQIADAIRRELMDQDGSDDEDEIISSDSEMSGYYAVGFGARSGVIPKEDSTGAARQTETPRMANDDVDLPDASGMEDLASVQEEDSKSQQATILPSSPKSGKRKTSIAEKTLYQRGLSSLLPESRRCTLDSNGLRHMFRCQTCFPPSTTASAPIGLICAACASACHANHDLRYEAVMQSNCGCPSPSCRARIRRPVGDGRQDPPGAKPTPQARLLPRKAAVYLRDALSEPAAMKVLLKAYEELCADANNEREVSSESMMAAITPTRDDEFQLITPSLAAAGFSEHNFDLWKNVDSSKHILDVVNKYSLPMRRLAAGPTFLVVGEGSNLTMINPANHLCLFQSDFSGHGASSNLTSSFSSTILAGSASSLKAEPLDVIDVGFVALQLEFNPMNPNLLLVGGLTNCAVLMLTNTGRLIKKVLIGFAAELSDCIRKVTWVPGSRSEFCIVTGCRLKTVDVFRSSVPIFSYRLAEEIAALVDAAFLPIKQQQNLSERKPDPPKPVLLLLSSSGCLLRQDLSIGDESEELLICEFLSTPSSDGRTATSLIPISSSRLFIHFSHGLLSHVTLDASLSRIEQHYLMEDDEPGSGRAIGTSIVIEESLLFTATHRPLKPQGSLVFYEFGPSTSKMIPRICGPTQAPVGKLVGAVVWGASENMRVIALHENGTLCTCWRGNSSFRHSSMIESAQPSPLMFERLTPLFQTASAAAGVQKPPSAAAAKPTTGNSGLHPVPSSNTKSASSSKLTAASLPNPNWQEFASMGMGMYRGCLSFTARACYIQGQLHSDPQVSGDNSTSSSIISTSGVTPLSSAADLKLALDPRVSACLASDSGVLEFCIYLASPTHCIAALRLLFGRHTGAETLPGSVRVFNRDIALAAANAVSPVPSSSMVTVEILLTKEEAMNVARLGGMSVTLVKAPNASSSTISLDGVDVFAAPIVDLDIIHAEVPMEFKGRNRHTGHQVTLQNLASPASVKHAPHACAKLLAASRASGLLLESEEDAINNGRLHTRQEFFRSFRKNHPDLFLRMSEVLFPDPYERMKVTDIVLLDRLMSTASQWTLAEFRTLGRAAIRSSRLFELALRSWSNIDVFGRARDCVAKFLWGQNRRDPLLVLTSFAAIGMAVVRMFPSMRPEFVTAIEVLFSNLETGFATADGLLSVLLARPNLVRSEVSFDGMDDQQETAVVQFQCDSCFTMPIRHSRWTCRSCQDFDLCEHCFFAAGFDHPKPQHEFVKNKLDKANYTESGCCSRCGELVGMCLPQAIATRTTFCLTCLDMGIEITERKERDSALDEEDEPFTAMDLTADLLDHLSFVKAPAMALVRYLTCATACYAQIRFENSSTMGERLFKLASETWLSNAVPGSKEELRALRTFPFVGLNLVPLINSARSSALPVSTAMQERRLTIANNALNQAPTRDQAKPKKAPFPSWLGALHPPLALMTFESFGWSPTSFLASCNGWIAPESPEVVDVFTLDEATVMDPMSGWESFVVLAMVNEDVVVLTQSAKGKEGEEDAIQKNRLIAWEDVFGRFLSRSTLSTSFADVVRFIRNMGLKSSVSDLLRTGVFRSSLADLRHACHRFTALDAEEGDDIANQRELAKRDTVLSVATILSRLRKTVAKSPTAEPWIKFCAQMRQQQQGGTGDKETDADGDVFKLLLWAASILFEFDLQSASAFLLILKALNADKDRGEELLSSTQANVEARLNTLSQAELSMCFSWLCMGNAQVRFSTLRLLLVLFRETFNLERKELFKWMVQRMAEIAFPSTMTGRNVRRVEALTLFSLVTNKYPQAVMAALETETAQKRLLESAMTAFESTMDRIKGMMLVRTCARSDAEALALALDVSSSAPLSNSPTNSNNSDGRKDSRLGMMYRDTSLTGSTAAEGGGGLLPPAALAATAGKDKSRQSTAASSGENFNKVNAFSLLFSPPCLTCGFLERPYRTQTLDHLRTQVAYLPSTIVMRLSRLYDIRAIALDLHPIRRGIANVIESVIVSVSSAYLPSSSSSGAAAKGDLDLPLLAQSSTEWETVAILSNFDAPPVSSAATSSTAASSSMLRALSASIAGSAASSSASAAAAAMAAVQGNGGNPTRTSSSAVLFPTVAATLIKFEFVLMKDRVESDRLLCPRCSKPVTSDHGVCSNCSEMVFQCRQCRNINYEDLRSFLCVQCGFCRYARFTFKADARPSVAYNDIASEKELIQARALLSSTVAKEEEVALEDLDVARHPLIMSLQQGKVAHVQQELAAAVNTPSSPLRESLTQAYFACLEADTLRKRIAECRARSGDQPKRFKRRSLTKSMEEFSIGRVDDDEEDSPHASEDTCFVCGYAFALANSAAVASLIAALAPTRGILDDVFAFTLSRKERIDMLMEWQEMQVTLDKLATMACLPRALASLESELASPLIPLVIARPDDVLPEVEARVGKAFDAALNVPLASQAATDAVDLLESLLSCSVQQQSTSALSENRASKVVSIVVTLLGKHLEAIGRLASPSEANSGRKRRALSPEIERLGLACLRALSKVVEQSGKGTISTPSPTLSPAQHLPASRPSFKRMRASSFEI